MSDIGLSFDTGTLVLLALAFFGAMMLLALPLFFITRYKGAGWGLICAGLLTIILGALAWQTVLKLIGDSTLGDALVLLLPLALWAMAAGLMIWLGQALRNRTSNRAD